VWGGIELCFEWEFVASRLDSSHLRVDSSHLRVASRLDSSHLRVDSSHLRVDSRLDSSHLRVGGCEWSAICDFDWREAWHVVEKSPQQVSFGLAPAGGGGARGRESYNPYLKQ